MQVETEQTLTASVNGRTYTAKFNGVRSRFEGDRLAYHHWLILCDDRPIGTMQDLSYGPRFCANFSQLRWRCMWKSTALDGLGYDTGPVGTVEETFTEAVKRADRYLEAAKALGLL